MIEANKGEQNLQEVTPLVSIRAGIQTCLDFRVHKLSPKLHCRFEMSQMTYLVIKLYHDSIILS